MTNQFYETAIEEFNKFSFSHDFEVDLKKSILINNASDQILILTSSFYQIGITLEKARVIILLALPDSNEWFDINTLTAFLGIETATKEDYTKPRKDKINDQIRRSLENVNKNQVAIREFFKADEALEARINLLRAYLLKE